MTRSPLPPGAWYDSLSGRMIALRVVEGSGGDGVAVGTAIS